MPMVPGTAQVELLNRELRNEVLHEYVLGRSNKCDVQFNDEKEQSHMKLSSRHCRIFCERSENDFGSPKLRVMIEDMSANGTFVNRGPAIGKGKRRPLNHGDEISLLRPVHNITKEDHKERAEQVAKLSFTFFNLHDRRAASRPARRTKSCGGGAASRPLVTDVYDIQQVIGRGTCGQVHRAVHRVTGLPWAVKVIETKKFAMTPGLSPEEILKEAETLRRISHPHVIKLNETFQSPNGQSVYLIMEIVEVRRCKTRPQRRRRGDTRCAGRGERRATLSGRVRAPGCGRRASRVDTRDVRLFRREALGWGFRRCGTASASGPLLVTGSNDGGAACCGW
jgi:pSer/pThr/pTyr-binding forkhead associated (FHA) protein